MKAGTKISDTTVTTFKEVPLYGWFAYRSEGRIGANNVFQKIADNDAPIDTPNARTFRGVHMNKTKYWFLPDAPVLIEKKPTQTSPNKADDLSDLM